MGYSIRWSTERPNELQIGSVSEELQGIVEPDDLIVSINGIVVSRNYPIFPTPKTESYDLRLIRDTQELQVSVKAVDGSSRIFTDIYAVILMWAVGSAILLIGDQKKDVLPALVFMLTSVGWLSIASFQLAESTAWLLGYVIVPVMGPLYASLAVTVSNDKMSLPKWLRGWFLVSLVWAIIGGFEYHILFPQNVSTHQIIGVEWLAVSYLSVGIGLLCLICYIPFRAARIQPSYIKRQLKVLGAFTSIGVFPFVVLTVLPRVFGTKSLLPGSVAFVFLMLLPIGFLFILLRRKHLLVEMETSRILLAILFAAVVILATSTVRLNLEHSGIDLPPVLGLMFGLLFLIGLYPNTGLHNLMRFMLYGKRQLTEPILQEIALRLANEPRWQSVDRELMRVVNALELGYLCLFVKRDATYQLLAGQSQVGATASVPLELELERALPKKTTRVSEVLPDSAQGLTARDVAIPLNYAGLTTGFLVASQRGIDEPLSENDLVQLQRVAEILSSNVLAINVFEQVDNNHALALYGREQERARLAAEIHDGPLQTLVILARKSQQKQKLNSVVGQLRQICQDLHNPILDDHIEYIVKDVTRAFQNEAFEIEQIIEPNVMKYGVSDKSKLAIYYILKEALSNVVKHAHAQSVDVNLSVANDQVRLAIKDDGGGQRTDSSYQNPSNKARQHRGLLDMHYWASIADGALKVENSYPKGWCVELIVPSYREPNHGLENKNTHFAALRA